MKKIVLLAFVSVLLSTAVVVTFVRPVTASLRVHNIDTGKDYATIQEAIDAPETLDGHTILVDAGIYYEHVVIDKSLTLIGENRTTTIIDGYGTETVVGVIAENITLSGFTIKNSGDMYVGIFLWYSNSNTLTGNILTNNDEAIRLMGSCCNKIIGNEIKNNGVGMKLEDSSWNVIYGNIIEYNTNGISVSSSGNNLTSNVVANNVHGISLSGGNNILRNNEMVTNDFNFGVYAHSLEDFINDIDTSNTVNGKPIYYLVNQNNLLVDSSSFPNVGYLGIVNSANVIVRDLNLTRNNQGVLLAYTTDSIVENVETSVNWVGIVLVYSSNNTVRRNDISSNGQEINGGYGFGIFLSHSNGNAIYNNKISNNGQGIGLTQSEDNVVYHNNFVDNQLSQAFSFDSLNIWDNGYPSGGNYWSDHGDVDLYSGPYQNETGSDGIGDTSYVINANNTDRYPLMGLFSFFNAGTWNEVTYYVYTVSNSTVSDFYFSEDNKLVNFNVTGPDNTVGFCRVTIPNELLWCDNPEQWTVLVNNTAVPYRVIENGAHTYLYFNYSHSIQNVQIKGIHVIPEFPAWTSMLIILIVLTVAIAIYKRRLLKTPIH